MIDEVLAQQDAYYAAFRGLDIDAMTAVWSGTEHDACIHPGWPILNGWPHVRRSYDSIFDGAGYMRIEVQDVDVHIVGDLARVTCMENVFTVHEGMTVHGNVAVTNLYQRVHGAWKMVLHHGSTTGASASGVAPDAN